MYSDKIHTYLKMIHAQDIHVAEKKKKLLDPPRNFVFVPIYNSISSLVSIS